MYAGSAPDTDITGGTGLLGTILIVATFSLIIVIVIVNCTIPRCKKKVHRELKPRVTIEMKRAVSLEDASTASASSKSAPKKPIRHSPSTHSTQQKTVQNYENVFIGVYRGQFASPSVSVAETSDVMDNVSSASDPFIDPKGEVDTSNKENRISYEEQCDKALERHISVRYENNNDQFDDNRGSNVSENHRSKGSVEISISVNSRV
ncbi:uncharacterized protein LOC117319868 [Pecten maximus]|uniref:uncharacterized protein LOC117319868 n=1 Tax=Pecten maximus TaxID=6579 RepID=UPI001457E66F|nr:uncharacterized protein LOC117319868 [Pecten maximus]XP_033730480.1 uncharacterized protein LOC117319868 [Pecten maximus]